MGDFQDRSQFENRQRYGSSDRMGADYMGSLSNAVQQHPVAAALIGMGVLWLFAGGSKVTVGGGGGRESIFGFAGEGARTISNTVGSAASSVGSGVSSGLHAVTDTVSNAVSGAVGAVSGAVSSAAGTVSDTVSGAAQDISNRWSEAGGDSARNYTSGDNAGDWRAESSSRSSSMASPLSTMRQNIGSVFEQYPLALAAAGLALGAGAAASLPLTRTERSVMAKAGETVIGKAREMGQQAADVASAAMDTAVDEAGSRIGGNTAGSSNSF